MQPFNLLSTADVAAIFGVCERTVRNNVESGDFPRPTKLLGKNFWHSGLLYAWLDQTMRGGASEQPLQQPMEPKIRVTKEKQSATERVKASQARNLAKIAA